MDDRVMVEYTLADVARARHSDGIESARLEPGQLVKLMFDFREEDGTPLGSESMWVEVTDDDDYVGALRSESVYADMGVGEPVDFETRHVIGVVQR